MLKPDCNLHSSNALAVLHCKNDIMFTQYYPVCQSQAMLLSYFQNLIESLYENSFQMFQL